MDDWNRGTTRQAPGCGSACWTASVPHGAGRGADAWTSCRDWVPAGKSPICGNSICQDRRFLARLMPRLERYFHYRNLDVTTLKELARRWSPAGAGRCRKKTGAHTALSDIRESVDGAGLLSAAHGQAGRRAGLRIRLFMGQADEICEFGWCWLLGLLASAASAMDEKAAVDLLRGKSGPPATACRTTRSTASRKRRTATCGSRPGKAWSATTARNSASSAAHNVPELEDNGIRSVSVGRTGSLVLGTSRGGVTVKRGEKWHDLHPQARAEPRTRSWRRWRIAAAASGSRPKAPASPASSKARCAVFNAQRRPAREGGVRADRRRQRRHLGRDAARAWRASKASACRCSRAPPACRRVRRSPCRSRRRAACSSAPSTACIVGEDGRFRKLAAISPTRPSPACRLTATAPSGSAPSTAA